VASGSSAKKVARLAQKGKGKKVRFQGGTLFPTIMAVVVIVGTGLISYARQAPAANDVAPTLSDRWHIPFGIYHCDSYLADLTGDMQKADTPDPNFAKYGVFSRGDGVIRWYPQVASSGKKAKLGLYLDTYGVQVTTKGITFPSSQNKGVSYATSKDQCKDASGKLVDAQVQVIVWPKASENSNSKRYITDFTNVRIVNDEMAIAVAYVAPGVQVPLPDSAAKLKDIVASEFGGATTTTVAKSAATSTTVAATTTTTGG
jgi:hypothetical protein